MTVPRMMMMPTEMMAIIIRWKESLEPLEDSDRRE